MKANSVSGCDCRTTNGKTAAMGWDDETIALPIPEHLLMNG
jgi:hypothetical protein